jgi:hypothetical protein
VSLLGTVKNYLKGWLNDGQRQRLRDLGSPLLCWFYRKDIKALATLFGSDKWNDHWYAKHYETHFHKLRTQPIHILEIGVGGYDDPTRGGASLRMWKSYFRRGQIFGLDLHEKSGLQESRITIFQGSQADPECLLGIVETLKQLDIVIDDGSHINSHVITSFECLFPQLVAGGLYVVEDTQTSYLKEYGGHPEPGHKETMMGYFSALCESVNSSDFGPDIDLTTLQKSIAGMHFYHNLIVIEKSAD